MSKFTAALDKIQDKHALNTEPSDELSPPPSKKTVKFLSRKKIILFVLAGAAIVFFTYAIGNYHGAKAVSAKPVPVISPSSIEVVQINAEETASETTSAKKAVSVNAPYYTIQLATFSKQETAHREVDNLASKGYEGFVRENGRFFEVCVFRFKERQLARKKLDDLMRFGFRDTYRDAFVKRVRA